MFKCKPDYEAAMRRVNAFWERADTDRPMVTFNYPKPGTARFPEKKHDSLEEYWLDVEYRTERDAYYAENTVFGAEAMPVIHPNLGPEIFSAWAGCPYIFGADTTWTEPCVADWDTDADRAVVDRGHRLFAKLEEYTKLLLQRGKGSFIAGLTDFHPGGDHLAALRDPAVLATDLLDYPGEVKKKLSATYDEYFSAFDHFVEMIKKSQTPISTWTPIVSESTMYVPSNDFSCMISPTMFNEFFLEGITSECRHYGNSIYHLDGPEALCHLDALCSIKELDAIQWVPGAGNEQTGRWLSVYKKILSRGKGLQITTVVPDDLDLLIEHLPAKGVWLSMGGIRNEAEAAEVMRKISRWGGR